MISDKRQMSLGAFAYPTGYHIAAWRHPECPADSGINFEYYCELARLAEAGKFDYIFFPDSLSMKGNDIEILSRSATRYVSQLEPLTLLSALASKTKRLGLAATASTTYHHPFHVARMFASLDFISNGRAAWNMVTSQNASEACQFGLSAHPEHTARYERAHEFVKVVQGLWDCWDDSAFIRNKESGIFFDTSKMRFLNHHGKHFSVKGPLNIPRSPQGRPIVFQAGSSELGIELGAETADVVFTAQAGLSEAKLFTSRLKALVKKKGRDNSQVKVIMGLLVCVGETQAEAEDWFAELQDLVEPSVGISLLNEELGGEVDLSQYCVDDLLPASFDTGGFKSRKAILLNKARRDKMTIKELYQYVAGGRGHCKVVGTATQVADIMEECFTQEGADGFVIMPPMAPSMLDAFVRRVVPELQRRGLFRKQYCGMTLRDHLGLRTS